MRLAVFSNVPILSLKKGQAFSFSHSAISDFHPSFERILMEIRQTAFAKIRHFEFAVA